MNKIIIDLTNSLLKARKNQLTAFNEKPEWQHGLGHRLADQALFYLLMFPCGALFLLGYSIISGSLEALGGGVLILVVCVICYIPYFRWYLKKYGD